MKLTKQILPVALLAFVMVACKNTDYKKTKEGFPYKVFSTGSGEKITAGNVVRYHLTNKLEDSLLGTSYGSPARWLGIPKTGEQTGLALMLLEARKGDSIMVIQPVDSIIAKTPQAAQDSFLMRNKGKSLKTYGKVVEVYKDEASAQQVFEKENMETYFKDPVMAQQRTKDAAELESYLKANNITTSKTPWGTYVQLLTPGAGPKAKAGQYVLLRYTGKLMNGEEFDSNNKPGAPLLPVQIGAGGTIIGFEDGVKQLSKGAKANIYIPSVVGYGAQGMPPKIAPNQNLVFALEVVDITDAPPAPPTMPQVDSTRN
ncbi:MAG TPA: FKBP-type peptidyl-prolyl cis-trans isomerase [Flavisolibacter sp.]